MAQPAYQYRPAPAPPAVVQTQNPAPIMRIIVTLLGAVGMVVGVFLDWVPGVLGLDLSSRALYRPVFVSDASRFFQTVGVIVIVLGLIALIGLVPRSGWLTRLAGALGIALFALFVIELYRVSGGPLPGSGAWVTVGGSILALIGGFLGTRPVVLSAVPPAA